VGAVYGAGTSRDTGRTMLKPRIGKRRAVYPPGYEERFPWVLIGPMAMRSRALRAFIFELPPSRPRMAVEARFFRFVVDHMSPGRVQKLMPAVHPDAEVEVFTFGTYRGREGWESAIADWHSSLKNDIEFEECLDLGAGKVAFFARVKVQGEASGVALTDEKLGFVVHVRDGMAVRGRFCRKAEALESVGLREGAHVEGDR
jgi:hypothetical protein